MDHLTVEQVISLHDMVCTAPIIARDKLDSAVHRSQNVEHYDDDATIHTMAAALFDGVIRAHAFEKGNKRAGVLAVNKFYVENGYEFCGESAQILHLAYDVAKDEIDLVELARGLEQLTRELPDERV